MILLNGVDINVSHFPDGTQQVWKCPEEAFKPNQVNQIYWKFTSEIELISLMQLVDLCRSKDIIDIELVLPYLPYGRQDKTICNSATFGLHTFMNLLISHLKISKLTVFDPHNCEFIQQFSKNIDIKMPDIDELLKNYDYVCYPDVGASKRYVHKLPALIGHKVRDQSTGRITSYQVTYPDNLVNDARVLVVDDICDGGATFLILGKALRDDMLITKADLYISHGIFSTGVPGVADLRRFYDTIITTDSVGGVENYSGVKVIPCL